MYKRYCIEQQEIEKLTGALEAKSLWDEPKYAEWKKTLQQKLENYIENNPRNEKLKADEIYNLFYPEKDIPIFISHSSKNKDIAQKLALWLKEKLGLYSFIDSDLWGNISEIQSSLDNKYCKSGTKFDYEKRNQCTAHVHMILTYALTRMIDKSDFFIFVKSNKSVSLQDSVQRTNSSRGVMLTGASPACCRACCSVVVWMAVRNRFVLGIGISSKELSRSSVAFTSCSYDDSF